MSHTGPSTISNNPPTHSSPIQTTTNNPTTPTSSSLHTNAHATSQSAQNTAANAQATAQNAAQSARETANTAQAQAQAKLREANATLHNLADQAAQHPIVQSSKEQVEVQLNAFDKQLAKFGFLNDLEARTNIPKTYGVLGFGVVFSLLILLNLFGLAQPITNLIGWALPAYLTVHALESPQKGDDAQWLCYWIVFGFLNYIESAALRLVLYYVPHYFTIKLFTTLWLMLPQFRGAEKVYYSALRPLFHQSKAKASQLSSNLNAHSQSASRTHAPSYSTSTLGNDSTTTTGYSTSINTHPSTAGVSAGSHNPFVSTSGGSQGITGTVGGMPPAAGVPLPETPGRGL